MIASTSLLLYSELFPPAVGGSGVLFDNVYGRIDIPNVVVLTNVCGTAPPDERRGQLTVRRRSIATRRWGALHPAAAAHHCRVARQLRSLFGPQRAIVHCGRILPEGLQARLATIKSPSRYVCWTHGEELAMLNTSRELRLLARDVHRHAAAILANSHHTASMLEAFGVDRTKIRVVHPGVDAERFTPSVDARALREKLVKPGELMLLSVGRLQRRKGHDMVVKALARLRHHTPSMRYVIVGAGEERGRLESLVRDLSLGDRVAFEGLADETMLPAYYAACDIFLMPNRVDGVDFEGFGIVFLEAAASSRPAIGGRSGGVVEAIEEGSSGLLVSGTDEDELAAAIARLASSDALRHEMGRAARGRVLTRFTWARAAADVANLHRLLLAGK